MYLKNKGKVVKIAKKMVHYHPFFLKVINRLMKLPMLNRFYYAYIRKYYHPTVPFRTKYLAESNNMSIQKNEDLTESARKIYIRLKPTSNQYRD